MTDLAPTRETYAAEDRRWLRDLHGLNDTLGVTLAGDLFTATAFPDGIVKSGTVLAQVTATGATQRLWGPYDPAATDGRQRAGGHLLDAHTVKAGRRTSVAVLDHGAVLRNYLPTQATAAGRLDAAAEGVLRIRYTNG